MTRLTVRAYRAEDADQLGEVFYASVHGGATRVYDAEQRSAWCPNRLRVRFGGTDSRLWNVSLPRTKAGS